jgi:hypothetical protein
MDSPPLQKSALERFCDRIATPPATHWPPRGLFLALIIALAVFIVADLTRWSDGRGLDLHKLMGEAGALLMCTYFYSRQRQIRLFSWFVGLTCLVFTLVLSWR